jgi:hypothetical protein
MALRIVIKTGIAASPHIFLRNLVSGDIRYLSMKEWTRDLHGVLTLCTELCCFYFSKPCSPGNENIENARYIFVL